MLFSKGLLVFIALGCLMMPGGASAQAERPSVEAYGALPSIEDVSISPDGQSIAYLSHDGDISKVIAQRRAGEVLVVVDTSDRRVRGVAWASNNHVAITSAATQRTAYFRGRNELELLDIVNITTHHVVRAMASADQRVSNAIFDWQRGEYRGVPVLFVQAVTEYTGEYLYDLYRVDLDTGRANRYARGAEDTRGFVVQRDGTVAARTSYNPENGLWRVSSYRGDIWREIQSVTAPLDTPGISGFGRTTNTLAITEKTDGHWRLSEISLENGSKTQDSDLGLSPNQIFHDANGKLVGVGRMDVYQDYEFFEPHLAAAWATLKEALPGNQLNLIDYSEDLSVIVFYVEGTGEPGAYFVYDTAAKHVSAIGRAYPALSGRQIAEVRIVRYKAQDGLDLVGYFTLPPGREPKSLPLIMMPHGGPAARDAAGFDWWSQAMASRGYAVFQPQFRGSSGFGIDLLEAGYGQWGRKMQTDVSDAIKVLADRGTIDRSRVCIVGASYGGYVALAGMTLEPGVYRCAVSFAGVSDLREMLLEEQRQGARGDANPTVRYWRRFMGADSANDSQLDNFSPARNADQVRGPILLIHGRQDTVVPLAQSQMMAEALGSAARFVVLDGEDHFLSTTATRQRMLSETVTFLEANNPPN